MVYYFSNNIQEKLYSLRMGWKRVHFSSNTCANHKQRAHCQNFVSLDCLWCSFHINPSQVTTWFLAQFGVKKRLKFFQRLRACAILLSSKILFVLINTKLNLKSRYYLCTFLRGVSAGFWGAFGDFVARGLGLVHLCLLKDKLEHPSPIRFLPQFSGFLFIVKVFING